MTICFLALTLMTLGGRSLARHFTFNSPFDSYGPVCWEDEKARLDNFAIALQNAEPTTIGHIIVYDGKIACRGEAIARANRAKKYLVEFRRIAADRVLLRWGGYQAESWTTLVINPQGAVIWPFSPNVAQDEVTFIGSCHQKIRSRKCPKR